MAHLRALFLSLSLSRPLSRSLRSRSDDLFGDASLLFGFRVDGCYRASTLLAPAVGIKNLRQQAERALGLGLFVSRKRKQGVIAKGRTDQGQARVIVWLTVGWPHSSLSGARCRVGLGLCLVPDHSAPKLRVTAMEEVRPHRRGTAVTRLASQIR